VKVKHQETSLVHLLKKFKTCTEILKDSNGKAKKSARVQKAEKELGLRMTEISRLTKSMRKNPNFSEANLNRIFDQAELSELASF
jgi:hypothetical protein